MPNVMLQVTGFPHVAPVDTCMANFLLQGLPDSFTFFGRFKIGGAWCVYACLCVFSIYMFGCLRVHTCDSKPFGLQVRSAQVA